jgi:hypothetical protein
MLYQYEDTNDKLANIHTKNGRKTQEFNFSTYIKKSRIYPQQIL